MPPAELIPADKAEEFWDDRYRTRPSTSSGQPSRMLVRFVENLKPGRALELGCARGDDAIWLAGLGWSVTAVDISGEALKIARIHAEDAGVAGRIEFQRHDLSQTFPEGTFDLVSAMFLQTPAEFPRAAVLHRAAGLVAPGGLLLIVSHGSKPPWATSHFDETFPTAEQALDELRLNLRDWNRVFVDSPERIHTFPDGQTAPLLDTVLALRRL